MAVKCICDRCNTEQATAPVTTPVPSAHSTQPIIARWIKVRISVTPMYITQLTIDICPACCEELGLPSDGRPLPRGDDYDAFTTLVRDISEEAIQDYNESM